MQLPFAFALAVQALGIRHRYIKPRPPQQNGKIERGHRIDQEEFWGRERFTDFDAAAVGLVPERISTYRRPGINLTRPNSLCHPRAAAHGDQTPGGGSEAGPHIPEFP
jgi:Integrase core domain